MRLSTPVCHTLWHWVWFMPDDVLAQIPAVSLEREGHAPGDADEVFWLESVVVLKRRQVRP